MKNGIGSAVRHSALQVAVYRAASNTYAKRQDVPCTQEGTPRADTSIRPGADIASFKIEPDQTLGFSLVYKGQVASAVWLVGSHFRHEQRLYTRRGGAAGEQRRWRRFGASGDLCTKRADAIRR